MSAETFCKFSMLRRCMKFFYFLARTECSQANVDNIQFNPFNKVKRYRVTRGLINSKVANRICVTVLGNNAVGQPPCLCVFTEHKCYMFNCGEGSMRIAKEKNSEFVNVKHVFITEKSWKNISGFADLYCTHRLYGVKKVTLHGPPRIEEVLKVLATNNKAVRLSKKNMEDSPYTDENIEIEYVPIYKKKSGFRKFGYSLQETENELDCVVSYICRVKAKPAELSLEKCVELGVPPSGPMLLKLKSGEDVVLPSGKLVCSQNVHEGYLPESTFLVVDCPSENLAEAFVNEKKLSPSQNCDITAVFHFSPTHVVKSYRYQNWMHKFPSNTLHIFLNSANSPVSSEAIHELQHVLHMLHPRIFPLLGENAKTASDLELEQRFIQADPRLQLHFRPNIMLDKSNIVHLMPGNYTQWALSNPNFQSELQRLHKEIDLIEAKITGNKQFENDYPEVIFLGTSSSTSTAYRNVTAILVQINPDCYVLLDCGEGCYMQLMRYFGCDKISSVLRKISCIFISHYHTDHYLGLFELLKARKEAFHSLNEKFIPASVLCPKILQIRIQKFHSVFESIKYHMRLYYNDVLSESMDPNEELKQLLDNVEIKPVPVHHCEESFGVVLTHKNWKIVYSGDCAPSQTLVDAGLDCSLLIHEASVEDNFHNEAYFKRHSTPAQVMDIADRMRAEFTIMTHFSKRYLAVPVFSDSKKIGCAFDNMAVRLKDLPLVPLFTPVLKALFSEQMKQNVEKNKSTFPVSFEKVFLKNAQKRNCL